MKRMTGITIFTLSAVIAGISLEAQTLPAKRRTAGAKKVWTNEDFAEKPQVRPVAAAVPVAAEKDIPVVEPVLKEPAPLTTTEKRLQKQSDDLDQEIALAQTTIDRLAPQRDELLAELKVLHDERDNVRSPEELSAVNARIAEKQQAMSAVTVPLRQAEDKLLDAQRQKEVLLKSADAAGEDRGATAPSPATP